jgi:uncharacterized protein involved in tolerance to divalent cations/predicted Rossmann-fold nucleotide-binding protein
MEKRQKIIIISGGQTGVDRAALDAALESGFEIQGWCPKGRIAEDGKISKKYPLKESITPDYLERTELNVIDSDGTLIIYQDVFEGGTKLTEKYAIKHKKPLLKFAVKEFNEKKVLEWLSKNKITRLNIAGPRASKKPKIYGDSKKLLKSLFAKINSERGDVCLIYTIFENKKQAEKICKKLVSQKLIACANIFSEIDSTYTWKGKLENSKEIPAILKSRKNNFTEIAAAVKKMHSYETPCIISIDVSSINDEYLAWLLCQTL